MQSRKSNVKIVTAPALPTTKITLVEAMGVFKTNAVMASTALVAMCASAALVYMFGYHLIPGARPKRETIREKVEEALQSLNPGKAKSTLAGYVSTATELFAVMTQADHAHQRVREYSPLIEKMAACASGEEAHALLMAHLDGHGIKGLDKLKLYVGLSGSNTPAKPKTATEQVSNRVKGTFSAIAELVADKKNNLTSVAAANAMATAMPQEMAPAMVKATLNRVQDVKMAEKVAQDACLHLANIDVDAFDGFVQRLVKQRDTLLKSAPAKANGKPVKGKAKAETAATTTN